ncbi:PKD domain-containing protein [Mariniflexile sp. AS56]|uniref:PKD domain-containing protein n=1 Tax=Mariniflexile sp. AS56 TaxID=3063957 RepID=UPI0026F2A510|nr:PKD domain-containing protein [Mariniflexile sp. AS56]MDO7173281.1 PKD domain-containing protein [Mariniflexile sp. AS56]
MKTISNLKKRVSGMCLGALALIACIAVTSCDPTIDALSYDLAEANSKEDLKPPVASFKATVTADYLTYTFANTSSSATDYVWNYGDGKTATSLDGENTFPAEGTYTVTLTATDKLGKTNTYSSEVIVIEPEVPPALNPGVINGNFDDGTSNWKPNSFSGGTTNAFNASSDGDPNNYDGTPSGASKTPGAKWTSSTSAGPLLSSSTRYAYQEMKLSENTNYILEYSYAIKTDVADIAGGDRVIVEILDGWFNDGADAVVSTPLVQTIGNEANGKGNFKVVKQVFSTNATGEISIWIYAITNDELYVDNVKVYPAI